MGFEDIRSVVVEPTLQGGPDVAEVKRQEAIDKAKEMAITFWKVSQDGSKGF